jgi:hypothetical protein
MFLCTISIGITTNRIESKKQRNSHTTGSNTQPAKGEGADTTSPDASSAQAIPLRPYVLWTPLPPEWVTVRKLSNPI